MQGEHGGSRGVGGRSTALQGFRMASLRRQHFKPCFTRRSQVIQGQGGRPRGRPGSGSWVGGCGWKLVMAEGMGWWLMRPLE